MDKTQKAAVVEEIASDLSEAQAIFAIDYRGISVPEAAELRGRLGEAEATFKIVKNRLAKRAAEQVGKGDLEPLLEGPTALTYVAGDPVVAAKAIATFSREHNVLAYKGGFMDGAALDADGFQAISRLPGVDVLHGQLVGLAASPLTGLVRGLGSLVSGLAIALGQVAEQGLVGGEAPAEAEETPAGEAEEPAAESEENAVAEEAGEGEGEGGEERPAAEEASEGEGGADEGEESKEPSTDAGGDDPGEGAD